MSKECTTHHHACDCREEKFRRLEQENATLNEMTRRHVAAYYELLEQNAVLRLDENRLFYVFWPGGSRRARHWLRKLMESKDYNDSTPTINTWRDAIDAARKERRT